MQQKPRKLSLTSSLLQLVGFFKSQLGYSDTWIIEYFVNSLQINRNLATLLVAIFNSNRSN